MFYNKVVAFICMVNHGSLRCVYTHISCDSTQPCSLSPSVWCTHTHHLGFQGPDLM